MSDADNPYRFVEAREPEESADGLRSPNVSADGWELGAYVAPANEPIYSPAEIAELGRRWSGFALTAFMDLLIAFVTASLTIAMLVMRESAGAGVFLLGYALLAFTGFRMLLWHDGSLLLLALRYERRRAALAALLFALPIANLSLLIPLKNETTAILRRHGIPAGFWRVATQALPRKVDDASKPST